MRAAIALVALTLSGCDLLGLSGGSSGGTFNATFSALTGANTLGDPFEAQTVKGYASTTTFSGRPERLQFISGWRPDREVTVTIPENPEVGATWQVKELPSDPDATHTGAAGVQYTDYRNGGELRWWVGTGKRGTVSTTTWDGKTLKIVFTDVEMQPNSSSTALATGTFLLSGTATIENFELQ